MKKTIHLLAVLLLSVVFSGAGVRTVLAAEQNHSTVSKHKTTSKPKQVVAKHLAKRSKTVNINTADVKTLSTVKEINKQKAQAIVDYRTEHGSFQSLEDLLKVKGFTKGKLNKIRQKISL